MEKKSKKISLTKKTFYLAQMNGGLEKNFYLFFAERKYKRFWTGFTIVEISEVLEAIFSKNFFSRPLLIWAN